MTNKPESLRQRIDLSTFTPGDIAIDDTGKENVFVGVNPFHQKRKYIFVSACGVLWQYEENGYPGHDRLDRLLYKKSQMDK